MRNDNHKREVEFKMENKKEVLKPRATILKQRFGLAYSYYQIDVVNWMVAFSYVGSSSKTEQKH
jgi:hypothetical protein